jgi:hypothetical protein
VLWRPNAGTVVTGPQVGNPLFLGGREVVADTYLAGQFDRDELLAWLRSDETRVTPDAE